MSVFVLWATEGPAVDGGLKVVGGIEVRGLVWEGKGGGLEGEIE